MQSKTFIRLLIIIQDGVIIEQYNELQKAIFNLKVIFETEQKSKL